MAATAGTMTKPARPLDPSFPKGPFTIARAEGAKWRVGLRPHFEYRDLGIEGATEGKVLAQVIRARQPCEGPGDEHAHTLDFQMVYVLKGWFKSEFEGEGVHTFHAGSCWIQPPRIRHTVLGYSDDCELLEIVLPAEFETVMLGK